MDKGTRVIGVGTHDGVVIEGQHGVIIDGGSARCKVLFDKRFDKELHSKWRRCWFVPPEQLIEEEAEVLIQEGFDIEKALFELLV